MTALRKNPLPADLGATMAGLASVGFTLLPLGGPSGKLPIVKGWADKPPLLRQVLAIMAQRGSCVYGVRTDGIAVVDCDDDDPKLVAEMEARFGPSAVHVKTPRGIHLYYSNVSVAAPNLKAEGLPVDIKTGSRNYVVGPLSERPDGGCYIALKGKLGETPLTPMGASPSAHRVTSSEITEGARHNGLTAAAIRMVECVNDPDELFGNLVALRDDLCERPETMPDAELRGIAKWAWTKRLEGKIFAGRDSSFAVHRLALDALRGLPNMSDAIALFVTLTGSHGHRPGKRFQLNWSGMKASGLTDLSERRFRDARRALEDIGLLVLAGKHRAGTRHQAFTLARLRPAIANAHNVQVLAPDDVRGKKRKGS